MEATAQLKKGGKFISLREAVSLIKDGDQLTLGGFTINRNPMALCREMIRQRKKDIYLVVHSHGQGMELMIGAGCVSRVELAYGGVARFAPTGIRFRKSVYSGELQVEDYSNFQMILRFMAGAMGLPFIATTSGLETDIVKKMGFPEEIRGKGRVPHRKLKVMRNPWNEEEGDVVLLPPLNPDVALIHAQYVGLDGTARIQGLTFADLEEAKASTLVIVTCEEIVPTEFIRRDPDQNSLPHFLVDAVVRAPYGAHPTACHYFYDYDSKHLRLCAEMSKNDDDFQRYLDEWVYPFETQENYLAKVGIEELLKIKANPAIGYAQGIDRR
ncbi:MAG: CoA transferase subunit A [Syntrophobacteraceae bacterium]